MKTYPLFFLLITLLLTACQPKPEACANNGSNTTDTAAQNEDGTTAVAPTSACPPADGPTPGGTTTDTSTVDGSDESDRDPLPNATQIFATNANFTNFQAADEVKADTALELIKQVIRTKAFRTRVLNHTWNGVKQFADNKGYTNAQIYQILLDGAETLRPEINHQMDLDLELYTDMSSITIGYTYPNVLKIWMNRKYFNQYAPYQVSHNIFHEWSHKLGFGHDSAATAKRPYSVPYGLGSIMLDLALQVQNGKLDPTME